MKYKLIGDNNILSPVLTVLKNRGINNVEEFLKAGDNPSSEHDYRKLSNINECVNTIEKHVKNDSKIWVQIDSDVDGYLSSFMIIDYLKKISTNTIEYRQHKEKQHGIYSKHVPDNVDLVIVPDAGSNNHEEHKALYDRGIEVLIIDHHQTEKDSSYAIVVNNQLNNYPNKELSGAAVVYKVLQALDDRFDVKLSKNYLDVVAVSIISDMMSLKTYENRYYVTQGLKNIRNTFLKKILYENKYIDKNNITPTDISFSLAPIINSVIRVGTSEDKNRVFKGLFLEDEKEIDSILELASSIKEKQDKQVDEQVERIEKEIEKRGLLKNKLLVVDVTNHLDKSLTGLVANRLSNHYKTPCLVLRKEDGVYKGSARGYDKGYIKDFKSFLNNTKLFEFAEGHENAFGVKIKEKNLERLIDFLNEEYSNIEIGVSEHIVDFKFEKGQVDYPVIFQIDKNKKLWGQDVDEPKAIVKDVMVERRQISVIGQNKNVIKFSYKDVDYIKFKASTKEIESLLLKGNRTDNIVLNIVGRLNINDFRGKKTGQIIIEDYKITKTNETKFVF